MSQGESEFEYLMGPQAWRTWALNREDLEGVRP
jgi:hypothetical protein